jgi:hypothetical protein
MWLRNAGGERQLSKLQIAAAATVGLFASSIILIGETMQEYSHLPYLVIDKFKVAEFLNAGFPLSAVSIFIVGFGVFIGVLLAVLYVAYLKK